MLGISIYPEKQKKQDILDYLSMCAKYGVKRVFSCLLSAEGNKEDIIQEFQEINNYATRLGMVVILDVNPRVFDKLGVSYNDLSLFKELGASGIRLDMGFDGKKEADMTYNPENLMIEINISNDNKYLDNILSYHPKISNLISSHNFYPQKYTGLSFEFFKRITQKFKDNSIITAAFVTSKNATVGPWPLSHGLCSLELLRDKSLKAQTKFLYATNLIDDVIIGDAFASEREIQEFTEASKDYITFTLTTESLSSNSLIENKILFEENHFRRGDTNDFMVRSTQSRVKYKQESFKPNNTPKILKRGDVVICNNNYGQYKGELQIILQEQENIELGRNKVGQIIDEELVLLDFLEPLERFKFEK
ncbi:DUF871 domain-containing protein [Mycoplasma hafezii]|uniref:DUF871 domain-containing protein n=1 Tax=Mycoplasma hafezii TaxID=525886 RepID=UPI003CF7D920